MIIHPDQWERYNARGSKPVVFFEQHKAWLHLLVEVSTSLKYTVETPTITGWWLTYPSEKYQSNGIFVPNIWKVIKKCSKPPTDFIHVLPCGVVSTLILRLPWIGASPIVISGTIPDPNHWVLSIVTNLNFMSIRTIIRNICVYIYICIIMYIYIHTYIYNYINI